MTLVAKTAVTQPSMTGSEDRIICTDCGAVAPDTDTAYTLIGHEHGWRLTFKRDSGGKQEPEWRCSACFKRAKAGRSEP